MSLVIRTADDSAALAAAVRDVVASVDPTVPVSEIHTGAELLSTSLAASRFTTVLLGAFAAVALTLAAIGIYGVLSCAVSRRTREIGIRVALGARRVDVVRMVLRRALLLAGLGTAGGVAAALATTRVLESLLFHSPTPNLRMPVQNDDIHPNGSMRNRCHAAARVRRATAAPV